MLSKEEKAFETLFVRLLTYAYCGYFKTIKPHGRDGEMRCDGYRASDYTVFQCYAPDRTAGRAMCAKI